MASPRGSFTALAEPTQAVVEAGWNWGVMYDWLDAIENVSAVELAHPYRVRAIAAAQVKTDLIDSHTLAKLLRVNLIPRAYVPGTETRRLREVVRQRVFLVRVRTMVKNRIQALLARHHVALPAVSDLFDKRGRDYLSMLKLEDGPAHELLRQDLELVETLSAEARATEKWLHQATLGDPRVALLRYPWTQQAASECGGISKIGLGRPTLRFPIFRSGEERRHSNL